MVLVSKHIVFASLLVAGAAVSAAPLARFRDSQSGALSARSLNANDALNTRSHYPSNTVVARSNPGDPSSVADLDTINSLSGRVQGKTIEELKKEVEKNTTALRYITETSGLVKLALTSADPVVLAAYQTKMDPAVLEWARRQLSLLNNNMKVLDGELEDAQDRLGHTTDGRVALGRQRMQALGKTQGPNDSPVIGLKRLRGSDPDTSQSSPNSRKK